MGCCTPRCVLLLICILQFVSTLERQVFDFMGYMWAPILGNFLQLLLVIFGAFGAAQYRSKYLMPYCVWTVLWVGWNVFVICFYLELGMLNKDLHILSLGTGSFSWWFTNGPGCDPIYSDNATLIDSWEPVFPDRIEGCWLDGQYVEIIHASLQCLLGVLGFGTAVHVIRMFNEEDDSSVSKSRPTSIYSIEYSTTERGGSPDSMLEARPMTPRKVKRRAGTRSSGRSQRSAARSHPNRSSARQRHTYINPVMRIMEQELDSSTSNDSYRHGVTAPKGGHSNPLYNNSRTSSIDTDLPQRPKSAQSNYSNFHGLRQFPLPPYEASQAAPQVPPYQNGSFPSVPRTTGYNHKPVYMFREVNGVINSETVI